MRKTIKTREVLKDIKVHDAAANIGDPMKNIGVKTKETVNENTNQADNVSPEQYAADKVSEAMKSGAESAAVGTEKAVRKGAVKAKEKIKGKIADVIANRVDRKGQGTQISRNPSINNHAHTLCSQLAKYTSKNRLKFMPKGLIGQLPQTLGKVFILSHNPQGYPQGN